MNSNIYESKFNCYSSMTCGTFLGNFLQILQKKNVNLRNTLVIQDRTFLTVIQGYKTLQNLC